MLKFLLKVFIGFFVLALAAGGYLYVYVKNHDVSREAKNFFIQEVNKKLEGKLSARDLRLQLKPGSLEIRVKGLKIRDKNSSEVLRLNKLEASLSTPNLLRLKVKFNKLHTDLLELNLIKSLDGKWNIYQIFKEKEKKGKLPEIDDLRINKINVRVTDEVQKNEVFYENLSLHWKKEKRHKRFFIELNPRNTNQDMKKAFLSFKGLLNFSKDFHQDPNFFIDLQLHELPISHLEFFLATFLSYKEFQEIQNNINKYLAAKAVLNGHVKINRVQKQLKVSLEQSVKNLCGFRNTNLAANFDLDDSIHIHKCDLNFDGEVFNISGDVNRWQDKNPRIDLKIKLNDNRLLDLMQNHFTFIKNENLEIILGKIKIINLNELFRGEINYSSDIKKQNLKLKLNLRQRVRQTFQAIEKVLTADLSFERDNFRIIDLNIPFNETTLSLNGKLNTKNKTFDLNLFTKDFAIEKFQEIFEGFNFFQEYQRYLSDSILNGYTYLDLQITDKFIKGTAKIIDGRFSKDDCPIEINQLNADLLVDDNNLIIKQLNGFLNGGFFSSSGEIELSNNQSKPKIRLDFIAQKLDISGILESGALDSFQFKRLLPESLFGEIANIKLKISTPQRGDYNLEGRCDIKDLSFQINENTPLISNVNGELILSKTLISSKNLSAFVNGAMLTGTGAIDTSGHIQSIDFNATNLYANDLYQLSILNNPRIAEFITNPSGSLDIALKYNPLGLEIFSTVKNLALRSLHEKFSEDLQNLNGKISFKNNKLALESLSLASGNSFGILSGEVQNLSKDSFEPLFKLLFKGKLHSKLLRKYTPPSINNALDYEGLLRSELALGGSSAKQNLDVKIFLDELKYLKFSNWLDLDKTISSKIKTKITITPNLISSNDAKAVFQKGTDKIQIKGRFQVKDYRNKEKLNYELLVESLPETETVKNKVALLAPHIFTIRPFNLVLSSGTFLCDTSGSSVDRLSLCKFNLGPSTAKRFGIGDLYSSASKIEFLSLVNKPAEMQMRMNSGNWNGLPYSDLSFNLAVDERFSRIRNLKTKIKDGFVESSIDFNYLNFDSEFKINGHNLPAHDIAESVWKLGSEIPSGLLDVNFIGKTKGLLPEEIFFNLEGKADLIIKDGKLSQLSLMQRILSAVNTVKNIDMNNIVHTLITFEGGHFNHLVSSLVYNRGKVSSEKFLLKAPQIEILAKGYIDYNKDFQDIRGQGMIPKYSKSILQKLGVGDLNLGNIASIANFSLGTHKSEKRFFKFKAKAKASDPNAIAQSIKESFAWL